MKPFFPRRLAAVLCAALTLSACSQPKPEPAGSQPGAPRGRYVERELPLPENLWNVISIDQLPDGSLWMCGFESEEIQDRSAIGEYGVWSSGDGGESWRQEEPDWLSQLTQDGYDPDCVQFVAEDDVYLFASRFLEEVDPETGEPVDDEDSSDGFFYGTWEGAIFRAHGGELNRYEGLAGRSTPSSIRYAGNGTLLLSYYDGSVLVDLESGAALREIDLKGEIRWGSGYLDGDTYVSVQPASITLYDLNGGEVTAELPYTAAAAPDKGYSTEPTNLTAVCPGDGGALYYCNHSGLYRILPDGSVTERLMDGELCSLGLPTLLLQYLIAREDGSFLTLCMEQDRSRFHLYRYTFDPDVPSVPETEMRVYSLEENQTVRQAVGQFQLQNPGVKITCQVGIAPDSGVTYDDALRSLSTELLAGSGPDVLILDGMPFASYAEKGVLLDLAPLLDKEISDGKLLPRVAEGFRREGKLYAVPARFTVPLIHGAAIGEIGGLPDMADWLERQDAPSLGTPGGNAANLILRRLYPACSGGWFREDGALDEDSFRRDLEAMRRMAAPAEDPEGDVWTETSQLAFGALAIKMGLSSLNFGYIGSLEDLAGPYTLIRESGEGETAYFPAGGAVLPCAVLGINAATGQAELARQFVAYTLSEEVLIHDFEDGLPVRLSVLERQAKQLGGLRIGTYGSGNVDEEFYILDCEMPPAQELLGWIEEWKSFSSFSCGDARVRRIVMEETEAYFLDERSLDATVDAVGNKLGLFLAE